MRTDHTSSTSFIIEHTHHHSFFFLSFTLILTLTLTLALSLSHSLTLTSSLNPDQVRPSFSIFSSERSNALTSAITAHQQRTSLDFCPLLCIYKSTPLRFHSTPDLSFPFLPYFHISFIIYHYPHKPSTSDYHFLATHTRPNKDSTRQRIAPCRISNPAIWCRPSMDWWPR